MQTGDNWLVGRLRPPLSWNWWQNGDFSGNIRNWRIFSLFPDLGKLAFLRRFGYNIGMQNIPKKPRLDDHGSAGLRPASCTPPLSGGLAPPETACVSQRSVRGTSRGDGKRISTFTRRQWAPFSDLPFET